MFKNGLALALIDDIPQRVKIAKVIATEKDIRRVVNIVPKHRPARYEEDVWDFSKCYVYSRNQRHVIDFRKCPEGMRDALKDFALLKIENASKITSISARVQSIKTVLLEAIKKDNTIFELLTDDDILNVITSRTCKNRTKGSYLTNVREMYEEMSRNGLAHLVDTKKLKIRERALLKMGSHEVPNHYMPVPEAYLNKLMTMFNRVMRDPAKPFDQRMTAGVMLLQTQLGLRVSEIVAFPADCLHVCDTTKGPRRYITYRSIKAARGPHEIILVDHMGTQLAFETLDYLLELRKECINSSEDFLYVDNNIGQYPVAPHILERRYKYLIKLYLPEAQQPVEGVRLASFRDTDKKWSIPSIHCYRVTVFSAMANCGVPYPFIEKMMSHTPDSSSDDGYYSDVKAENNVWSNFKH